MLHHLPKKIPQACVREIYRVLKPGGRVLAVDFDGSSRHSFISHFHRHSYVNLDELLGLVTGAGMQPVNSGPVGLNNLHCARQRTNRQDCTMTAHIRLPKSTRLLTLLILLLLSAHLLVPYFFSQR